jgi:hypothetical protein
MKNSLKEEEFKNKHTFIITCFIHGLTLWPQKKILQLYKLTKELGVTRDYYKDFLKPIRLNKQEKSLLLHISRLSELGSIRDMIGVQSK